MNTGRDYGINQIRARKRHSCYGMGLGIIILDDVFPGFPGDVRNASAYPFPIQYEIAKSVDMPTLVESKDKSPCLDPIIIAARNLEKMGCRAIAAECGYFAYFQKEITASVDIPVFLSSLLQVPIAQIVVGAEKTVGILVSRSKFITDHHLRSAGIEPGSNYVIRGARDDGSCHEFENLWNKETRPSVPTANYEKTEKELLSVALNFYKEYPDMGAMVLECTGFPPFARTLQRWIDIPVFSYSTLLDYAYSVVVHRDFYGHV